MQKPYLEVNGTTLCFFDPTQCDQISFEKGYTWWYWFLWSFPTLSLLILMNYWTFHGLHVWLDDFKKGLMGYILIWWVILFPFVFLLPLAVATKEDAVPANAKTGVLALTFTIVAIALGGIGYLWYLIQGGSFESFFGTGSGPKIIFVTETTKPVEPGVAEPTSADKYNKM